MTIHNTTMTRADAALALAKWLRGVAGTFRDHIAEQRAALCEDCAEQETLLTMSESDALKLAGRLEDVAGVVTSLVFGREVLQ